jgi:hypothetical protein
MSTRLTEDHDDDLISFEVNGATPLPTANAQGHVEHDGARYLVQRAWFWSTSHHVARRTGP